METRSKKPKPPHNSIPDYIRTETATVKFFVNTPGKYFGFVITDDVPPPPSAKVDSEELFFHLGAKCEVDIQSTSMFDLEYLEHHTQLNEAFHEFHPHLSFANLIDREGCIHVPDCPEGIILPHWPPRMPSKGDTLVIVRGPNPQKGGFKVVKWCFYDEWKDACDLLDRYPTYRLARRTIRPFNRGTKMEYMWTGKNLVKLKDQFHPNLYPLGMTTNVSGDTMNTWIERFNPDTEEWVRQDGDVRTKEGHFLNPQS